MSALVAKPSTTTFKHPSDRRRTFAIISHPDAGKTTLTEKLLLYGGAVHLAGSVTARKNQRTATSDWMELEKQRGISVTSTVLQFEYGDYVINLLDTPGHKDFSEDTYRILSAVDAAVMVLDAGKGVEAQTRKLFEVCRRRGVPIFTFVNKMDRPARKPLELLDEVESVLGIESYACNWPIGDGDRFKGVFDREGNQVHTFERTPGAAHKAPVTVSGIDDEKFRSMLFPNIYEQLVEELAIVNEVGAEFDQDRVDRGDLSPVFFGSAANNFGVQLLLDGFLRMAPRPVARTSNGRTVTPTDENFSGFIFKIQANMNPKHRDRVAFIRIVSGKFERDMHVVNSRTGEKVRLANSQRLFAQERETVDEAWAGDVVGIVGNQELFIGDTLALDPSVIYDELPLFAPECFAYVHNTSTAKAKRFRSGLDQLLKEGVAQLYELPDALQRIPLLGAVGPLQYEVLSHRLENEYGADCRIELTPWKMARWIHPRNKETPASEKPNVTLPSGAALAKDPIGNWVALFANDWSADLFDEKNPDYTVEKTPPD